MNVKQLDISKVWVVEYSVLRDSWHVGTLEQALEGNLEHCLTMDDAGNNDYKIVTMADSIEEAHSLLDKIKSKQQEFQTNSNNSVD